MYEEKKKEEDSPSFKIALMHRLEVYIKKRGKKTDYSDQKQYRQHEDQLNRNNQNTKMGRK